MQYDFDGLVIGGNADGLALAARLAESGRAVAVLEKGMKVGGELLTESFLTHHRFNLSGGWLIGDRLADLGISGFRSNDRRLLLPDVPLAFLFDGQKPLVFYRAAARLREQIIRADRAGFDRLLKFGEGLYGSLLGYFSAAGKSDFFEKKNMLAAMAPAMTVKQVLDHFGFADRRLRCALTYLPLAFGHDIEAEGSGAMMAYLLFGLTHLSIVDGGSVLLAAALADSIIVNGGMIIESAGIARISAPAGKAKRVELRDGRVFSAPVIVWAGNDRDPSDPGSSLPPKAAAHRELGIYRSYLGFAHNPSGFHGNDRIYEDVNRAYMVAFGFNDEAAIYRYLQLARIGQPPFIAGHVIANGHLDPVSQVGALGLRTGQLWCTSCHTRDVQELRGPFADPAQGLTVATHAADRRRPGPGDALVEAGGIEAYLERGVTTAEDRNGPGVVPSPGAHGMKVEQRALRPATGALIWQGVLATQTRMADPEGFRKSFEQACTDRLLARLGGLDRKDVTFRLTWLPKETQEPLQRSNLLAMLANRGSANSCLTAQEGVYRNPHSRLSTLTGMATAQWLSIALEGELAQQRKETD